MQSSKEQQGKIRKPSSAINAKKQRKTIEWERLEISSRKLEKKKKKKREREKKENQRPQGKISCKDGLDKGQKSYGPNIRLGPYLIRRD